MSTPNNNDLREGFDGFVGDMAEAERAKGLMPAAEQNAKLAAELFTTMEARGDFAREASAKPSSEPAWPDMQGRPEDAKLVAHRDADAKTRDVSPFSQAIYKRFMLLLNYRERGPLGQPSWHERASWVHGFFASDRKRWSAEMIKLMEDSVRHFGEWRPISKGGIHL
ncbi:MAG: hypothetical protein E6Q97_38495 [Desulfurellales bacterium]|nr:MAG: hypothetical protein E6Q97_38495 [Desulfurellales bacterium]